MAHCAGVAEFAGKAVVTIDNLTVDYDSAADSGAEGNHDEILHSLGCAVGHLTHRRRIGIIGKRDRDSSESLRKHP